MSSQNRRSPAETLYIIMLRHIGFSKPLLSEAYLRNNLSPFGKKSIERASERIEGPLAHQVHKWPVRPTNKIPGKGVVSNSQLIEMSILAASMYYLYNEKIYEDLSMNEVIDAYDLYTNLRKTSKEIAPQISPDTAFWLSREFKSHFALVPLCERCGVRYYSSIEQKIKNACPFCKETGVGDFDKAS